MSTDTVVHTSCTLCEAMCGLEVTAGPRRPGRGHPG